MLLLTKSLDLPPKEDGRADGGQGEDAEDDDAHDPPGVGADGVLAVLPVEALLAAAAGRLGRRHTFAVVAAAAVERRADVFGKKVLLVFGN